MPSHWEDENARRKAARSLEILANISYLIKAYANDPEKVVHYMEIADQSIAELIGYIIPDHN
jgi:hypothetical protein